MSDNSNNRKVSVSNSNHYMGREYYRGNLTFFHISIPTNIIFYLFI
jgi:hypothetical protein